MIKNTGTEVLLIFQNVRLLADKNTGAISEHTVNQTIAVVSISPGTAKDLHIVLGDVVATHQESYGPISTPFTVRREAERSPQGSRMKNQRSNVMNASATKSPHRH